MTAALFTRHGETPLTITREELIPGMEFWVVEPVGRFRDAPDARGSRMTHPLPCHAGRDLTETWARVVKDLETLDLVP